jgi:AcrR family transcriptional regulator
MSRSEKEKAFRRKLLSDTAARLFKSKSYHSIKVDDITSEADFSKGSFYRYFYNKDELVFEIIFNEISRLNEALEKTAQEPGNISSLFLNVAEALLLFHGNTVHLLFIMEELFNKNDNLSGTSDSNSFVADKLRQSWKTKIEVAMNRRKLLLDSIVQNCIEKQYLKNIKPQLLSETMDWLTKGMSFSNAAGRHDLNEIVGLLLEGVKK